MLALVLRAFRIKTIIILFTLLLLLTHCIILMIYDFTRRSEYYKTLKETTERLDKAYLVLATLEVPDFYDGKIMNEILYEINKSMRENVKGLEIQNSDFREYIEMWIHEIKMPLSTLNLITHNRKSDADAELKEQLKRITDYVDQVLYYVRSENSAEDYLIKKVPLKKVVNTVALNHKDSLLYSRIDFIVENIGFEVNTDAKWLEFILNQIVQNAIKYKRQIPESYIKISAKSDNNTVRLYVEDNGIGIPAEDIRRVFDKSFTGYNGRTRAKSTGMGLYIAKKLCKKLGHTIGIESKKDHFTRVCITFQANDFFEVLS
ncbi:MAG: sensor histidine kinase [Faecalimonas sp.]|nr:sensor histidine kinase [Faecalimonas sp.]